MAILDHPLYGTEAVGRVKSTVTFFPRSANPLCTDEGEKVWYHLISITYRKESSSESRRAQKNKFQDAVIAWYALTPTEKSYWEGQATGLQTAYNAFLSNYLLTH
ncbi:hypothetical protein MUP46_03060 [Patescibacteria group bacterium]|nr:hypothetical protein [Patescibacteria group bacterium]